MSEDDEDEDEVEVAASFPRSHRVYCSGWLSSRLTSNDRRRASGACPRSRTSSKSAVKAGLGLTQGSSAHGRSLSRLCRLASQHEAAPFKQCGRSDQ